MALAAKKDVYGTFSNDQEWVQVVYDFSVDGGSSTDYDVIEAKDARKAELLNEAPF
jgi:hypothetical protein